MRTPPADQRPGDLAQAYAIAQSLVAASGEAVVGWKIGATSDRAQGFLGLQAPFWGAVTASHLLASPGVLPTAGAPFEGEPEIALKLARDFGPADEAPSEAETAAALEGAYFAIEINRPSFKRPFEAGALCLIADNGVNRALIMGAPVQNWRSRDLGDIALSLSNGTASVAGTATGSGFSPLKALAWLAWAKARAGQPLRAGEVVATGLIGGSLRVSPGEGLKVHAEGDLVVSMRVRDQAGG